MPQFNVGDRVEWSYDGQWEWEDEVRRGTIIDRPEDTQWEAWSDTSYDYYVEDEDGDFHGLEEYEVREYTPPAPKRPTGFASFMRSHNV